MFPDFNLYSTPLLILTVQGIIFALLLFWRYHKLKNKSDLFLALILIITCYHQINYTIGFLGWYDTFRNTKINYYLVRLSFALAPLIYFYFRSVTNPKRAFNQKDLLHFLPVMMLILIRLYILIYDANQIGFADTQNGELVINFQWKFLDPIADLLAMIQMLIYLVLSFQLFYTYKEKIKQFFSNTYNLELNWLHHFLIFYSILFLYYTFQLVIDAAITDLSWMQEWWYYFLTGIVITYVGIRGYITNLSRLKEADISSYLNENNTITSTTSQPEQKSIALTAQQEADKSNIITYFKEHKPHLEPDLTLNKLADKLSFSREQLSEVINKGFQLKFNDFINSYRIEDFKQRLDQGHHKKLSLIGLSYECGFNSKATFNRAFKKFNNQSPSAYLETIK